MSRPGLAALAALCCFAVACKDPQRQEFETRALSARELVAEGRKAAAKGKHEKAVSSYKQAISQTPDDVSVYLLLADTYRLMGNEPGAILTLRQAEQIGGKDDPSLKRARADLYLKMHQVPNAVTELISLRDAELLTDPEILDLARLQAHSGRVDDGFKSLDKVLMRSPDDPEAKTVEAEILLLRGDELLAAQRMDKIIEANPALTNARLVRARYFLANGQVALAEKDLAMVRQEDLKRVDVVTLRVTVLDLLGRYDESAGILQPLIDESPKDADLQSLLAETRLRAGKTQDAQLLADRALTLQPKCARALFVRAELQTNPDAARLDYDAAVKADPGFAPAFSKLWRLSAAQGDKAEALRALERLRELGEINAEDKVALAGLYADTGSNLELGKKLIDEALKREPNNAEYKTLKARLVKQTTPKKRGNSGSGIIIMKHR